MNTETVDVSGLKKGDKVALFGSVYRVTPGVRSMVFAEDRGFNWFELEAVPPGVTFERVAPDPKEFRIRSVIEPEILSIEFVQTPDPDRVIILIETDEEEDAGLTVDKGNLKAVVEKL